MVKQLFRYRLPMKNGKLREGLILQCEDRFGEIAPLPGFSKETLQEAQKEAEEWIEKGKEPTLPSVQFGIACLKQPLDSIRIPLCALGIKKNFSTLKLKLGHLSLKEAIVFVKSQVGKVHLRLDCNRAWTLNQALEFARHFNPSDFLYLEEPVQTFEELIQFSQKTDFPVALDESIHTDWSQIPSLKAIVVKPTVVGSIPDLPPHLDLVLSSTYESGLGLLHIAHLAKSHLPIGLDTVFSEDVLLNPIDCSSGFFSWKRSSPLLNISKLIRSDQKNCMIKS